MKADGQFPIEVGWGGLGGGLSSGLSDQKVVFGERFFVLFSCKYKE